MIKVLPPPQPGSWERCSSEIQPHLWRGLSCSRPSARTEFDPHPSQALHHVATSASSRRQWETTLLAAETPCGSLEFSQLLVTCAEAHAITSFRTGTQDAADSCSLLHSQPEMQAQATTSYPQARPPLCHGTPSSLDIDLPLSFRVARQR